MIVVTIVYVYIYVCVCVCVCYFKVVYVDGMHNLCKSYSQIWFFVSCFKIFGYSFVHSFLLPYCCCCGQSLILNMNMHFPE